MQGGRPREPPPRLPTPSAQGLIILNKVDLRGARARCRGADPLTGALHLKSPSLPQACWKLVPSPPYHPGAQTAWGEPGPRNEPGSGLAPPPAAPGAGGQVTALPRSHPGCQAWFGSYIKVGAGIGNEIGPAGGGRARSRIYPGLVS